LSTSLHEFQGLSIMEATLCGAIPILPNRLCYPDFFPKQNLYETHKDYKKESLGAAKLITKAINNPETLNPNCNNFKDFKNKWNLYLNSL